MPRNDANGLARGMTNPELSWRCIGPDPTWCPQLEILLPGIGQALDLGRDFSLINICADDAPEQESCWFKMRPAGRGDDPRLVLDFFCSTRSFSQPGPGRRTVQPARQIWDKQQDPRPTPESNPQDFSIAQAEVFLHHNLALAQDLARGDLSLDSIPKGQVEAFEAAWEVVVDGRLARAGLPGYSLADRRGIFSRLFSSAGVLMPDHWQIFESLWDGGLASGRDVLAVLRQLPRLRQ